MVVPLLGVGDHNHVLLANVAQSLHDVVRELLVEVDFRWGIRVVGWEDVLERVHITIVVLDRALEDQVIIWWFARKFFKNETLVNLQNRSACIVNWG